MADVATIDEQAGTGGRTATTGGDELFRIEERGLEPVPDADRHGHPRELFLVWAAALADFFSFLAGAILVGFLGLGFVDAALVLVLGALAGAVLLGPLGVTGARTGLPQIVYSRITFGRHGAIIGGVLTALIAVGWFAYDCAIAVTTAQSLPVFGDHPAGWIRWAMLAGMVAGCIAVAVLGHRTITVVESVQAPAFMLVCIGLTVALWPHFQLGLRSSLDTGPHLAAALAGFTATFALIVSWATYAGDYSRYLPRRSSAWQISLFSGGGSMVTLVVCGLLGAAVQSIDPANQNLAGLIVGGLPLWFAWIFVVFIVVAEMSSNYLNIYTASLSALACGLRLRRWQAAGLVGLVGGLYAAWILPRSDFQGTYLSFLTLTYVWFPAWCMVVLVDFWRRRGHLDAAEAMRRPASLGAGIKWPAVATFVLATGATVLFYNAQGFFVGPVASLLFHDQPADISSGVGVLASTVLFLVLLRVRPGRRRVAVA